MLRQLHLLLALLGRLPGASPRLRLGYPHLLHMHLSLGPWPRQPPQQQQQQQVPRLQLPMPGQQQRSRALLPLLSLLWLPR